MEIMRLVEKTVSHMTEWTLQHADMEPDEFKAAYLDEWERQKESFEEELTEN